MVTERKAMAELESQRDESTHLDPQSDGPVGHFQPHTSSHPLPPPFIPSSPPPSSPPFQIAPGDVNGLGMAGAARSSKSSRPATNYAGNPPRPPNAWILYRSDKMKALSTTDPSKPSRPQSDLSKQIATMWKNERPEVRILYEQASELRKAEHAEMYPNYRFQPLTREQKEKLREEKRLQKEQAKAARHAAKTKRIGSGVSSTGGASLSNASMSQPLKRVDTSGLLAPYLNLTGFDQTPSPSQTASKPSTSKLPSTSRFARPSTSDFAASSSSQTDSSRDGSAYPASPVVQQPLAMAAPHPGIPSMGLPSPPWQNSLSQPDVSLLQADATNYSEELLLNAPELSFPHDDNAFSSFDTSNSFDFDFSGSMPGLEATGDPSTYESTELDKVIADMEREGAFNFNMPAEDYNAFLIDYDPAKSGYFNFGASDLAPEGMAGPSSATEQQTTSNPSTNLIDINSILRIASEATNVSSAVSPFSHVSPNALMSRTPSYNVPPQASETPMSPVSAMSSPGVASAPETTNETVSTTRRAAIANTSARRVGGDWRTAVQHRISS